jgi:hypothetical protein
MQKPYPFWASDNPYDKFLNTCKLEEFLILTLAPKLFLEFSSTRCFKADLLGRFEPVG